MRKKTAAYRLNIKALGISCPQAQGTEIVIIGLAADDTWYDAVEIFDNSWLEKDGAYNWRSYDNNGIKDTICADIPSAGRIVLVLEKNRWRGICEAAYRDKTSRIDCYGDCDESGLIMLSLAPGSDSRHPLKARISRRLNRRRDIFYEKKLCVLGDSYARNHCRPYTETWHFLFSLKHRMQYCNYGINGNGIAGRASGVPMLERYRQMPQDADFIFVMGGKNDYNIQLDVKTFRGGVQRLLQGLKDRYPRAEIVFFTPWKIVLDDRDDAQGTALRVYAQTIIEVCRSFSVPVFDASESEIKVWQKEFREKYMQSPDDVSHLNAQGHRLMLKEAEQFLKRVYAEKNVSYYIKKICKEGGQNK